MDLKAPQELWNQLNKAVTDEFLDSGGHSKRKCLQDRTDFQFAWQTVTLWGVDVRSWFRDIEKNSEKYDNMMAHGSVIA